MITKNDNTYEFTINGTAGFLTCDNEYTLKFQNQVINFSNLKLLHLYVNSLTDIVEHIDSILIQKDKE